MAKYSFVRQNDGTDCGAAALATVMRHYQMSMGLEQLRDLTGTDRIGTNLLALLRAAERLGFAAKGVEAPYEMLPKIPLPAIAHVKLENGAGHFIVVHQADAKGVIVADPAKTGTQKLTKEQFNAKWTRRLLILAPDPKITKSDFTEGPPSPWRRLCGLLSEHTGVLFEAFLLAMVFTLLGISTSYFIQHLVDNVLVRNETRLLNAMGIGMLLILVFRTLLNIVRQYLMARVGRKIDLILISNYARHVLNLPMKFFEMRRVGEILSRIQDVTHVRTAISGTSLSALVDATMVILMSVFLWVHDWQLALVATLFVPVLVGGVGIFHPAVKRRAREGMEQAAKMSSHMIEDVSGIETVKAFGAERLRAEQGEQHLVRLVRTSFDIQKLSIGMGTVGTLVRGAAGLAILWYGGYRVMDGAITLGQLMFFNSLLAYMIQPLERLSQLNISLQQALISIDRLFQILDIDQERITDPQLAKFDKLNDALVLENVSFKYGCRKNVLEEVNLRFPTGKTVGIVGESGSGKTTLLKLLLGFHHPTEGAVKVDGVDMRDMDLASWRAHVGLVSQEVFIFNGTIRDNIALGAPGARLDQITAAATAAGLHEFIAELPDRYETLIGERGTNLSGGERQRLAIARALLADPEILIFDEATSHLDTATERTVQEALRSLFVGKTVVLVAHRLSTIMDADLIYVLRNGRVEENGTHDELIAERGRYSALWNVQTGANRMARPVLTGNGMPGVGNGIVHVATPVKG